MSCSNNNDKNPVNKGYYPSKEPVESESIRKSSNSDITIPARTSLSASQDTNSPDNMRGFDPISEDDTGDYGVSRYLENTDEEGWD